MKKNLLVIGFGLLLVVGFYWNNIFGPVVNVTPAVGTNDFTDLNYPFRHFLNESLKRGEIPLWSSEISSGYPLHAEGQAGALYPLHWIFINLPTLQSLLASVVLHYFLIFTFTFLYLRRLKLSHVAVAFGAMVVTFSGFSVNEIMHLNILVSFAFFIGQLWLLEILIEKKGGLVWVLLMGVFLGFSVLGGHPQITFYSLLFLGPYWLYWWFSRVGKSYIRLIVYGFLYATVGIGIGAGQFLPQLEFTRASTRSAGLSAAAIEHYSFPFSHLITFVLPFSKIDPNHTFEGFVNNGWPADERYVYMGILGLVLGFVPIVRFFKFGKLALFFGLAIVLAMLFSFGTQLMTGYILMQPPFSFFRIPFKMIFVVNFSFGVLGAMAVDGFRKWFEKLKVHVSLKVLAFGLLFAFGFFDLWYNAKKLYPEFDANVWYSEPEVVPYLKERLRNQERVTSQQYAMPSFEIFVKNPELWDDPKIHVNLRNLLPIFNNLLYDIPKNVGAANSAGLKITRYNELEHKIFFRGLSDNGNGTIGVSDEALFLNRIMGVRFFLSGNVIQNYLLSRVKEITFDTDQDPVIVYEFADYFPRVMMVPKSEKATPEEILEHFEKVNFDPKKIVYLDEEVEWGAKGGYSATSIIESYTDQEVVVSTQASGDGFLFLSDTYYPGWKAYVDDRETTIYRANYAFRAVPVPEGKHTVKFRYEPESFKWGVKISVIALTSTIAGIIVLAALSKLKKKR